MRRRTHVFATLLAAVAFVPTVYGQAQVPSPAPPSQPATKQEPISIPELRKALGTPTTVTATVSAIDYDERVLVLRNEKGVDEAIYVGDEVKRLADIKAGDRVSVTYYMSLATRLMQPGEASRTGATEAVVGTTGADRPGGTASYQQRWTMTVNSIDTAAQTVVATSERGRSHTFKVEDAARLASLKVGDRVEITFTAAALLNVKPER